MNDIATQMEREALRELALTQQLNDALRDEVERLRALIAKAEWLGSSWGITACPWCRESVHMERHAPDCPAFSAMGEVRR